MSDKQLKIEGMKGKEIARAVLSIISADSENIHVLTKEAAEELSQVIIDSGYGEGIITGPFLGGQGSQYYSVSK